MQLTFYHHPRCSKSRQALALLQEKGFTPEVVEYQKTPPSRETFAQIAALLLPTLKKLRGTGGGDVRAMMRQKDALFKELGLADASLSNEDLLDALAEHPALLERPVLVATQADGAAKATAKAVIGRPPERVLDLVAS